MLPELYWQQQTLADSPPYFVQQLPECASNAVKTIIPVLAQKSGKDKPQAGGLFFSNPATHQSFSLLAVIKSQQTVGRAVKRAFFLGMQPE